MIWDEVQLPVYTFSDAETPITQYIPIPAIVSAKAEKIWVSSYGEFSGPQPAPGSGWPDGNEVGVELWGCDGYDGQGPRTSGDINADYCGPGLGYTLNSISPDVISPPQGATPLFSIYRTFFGSWPYRICPEPSELGQIISPRHALRFFWMANENWPDCKPIWVSAKIKYGYDA